MMPPFRMWRGPAACSACGVHSATSMSPSQWLFSWRPSGLSAPQPQQKLSRIWSWTATVSGVGIPGCCRSARTRATAPGLSAGVALGRESGQAVVSRASKLRSPVP